MARLILLAHGSIAAGRGLLFGSSWPSIPVGFGLFAAVVVLVGLCAHQAAKEKPNGNATTDRTTSKKKSMTRTISRNNKINPSATQKKRGGGGDDHAHEIRVDISAQVPLPSSAPPAAAAAEKRREKISPPPPPHRKNSKDLNASSRRRDGSVGGGNEKKGKIGPKVATGGFGEGGLWQKSILRGEKCQLPEFSGVIFYDSRGNQIQLAE